MSEPPVNRPKEPGYSSEPQPRPPQVVVQSSTQEDMVRAIAASRSFYGPALLTLALYWFTFWIGGLIANLVYLNSASNAQKLSGVSPEGKGCLWLLLIVHVVLPILGTCAFFALGGFAMLAEGW